MRSALHPVAQVQHPVPLDHLVRTVQQVLAVDRTEVALARTEHDGYDVHAYLVDQTCGEQLATDIAGGNLDQAVTGQLLCSGHRGLDAVDEVVGSLRGPAGGWRPVRHDDHVVDTARGRPVPAIGQVEDVPSDDGHPDLVPVRPGVVVGRLGHVELAAGVQRDVTVAVPVEQGSRLVVLVGDEAVHRHHVVHDYLAHG